jgi:hypothetical protein
VVFARKKFLDEPLRMNANFASSNHAAAYEVSTLSQFTQTTGISVFGVRFQSVNTLRFDINAGEPGRTIS